MSSIEKISEISLVPKDPTVWEIINLGVFGPREGPAVAPLNDTEIFIFGGWSSSGYEGEGFIFDTKTEKCSKVFDAR